MSGGSRKPDLSVVRDALTGGTSRRKFAKTLLSAGFGATAARWLVPDDFRASPSGEVPIVYAVARRDPDDPATLEPRKRTVPQQWYVQLSNTFEVYERLLGGDLSGIVGTFVSPGSYIDGATIHVDVAEERIRDRLTDLSEEVTLDISELSDFPPRPESRGIGAASVTYAVDVGRPDVGGGYACGIKDSIATLAPALYDSETGESFFTTANHLYGEGGTLETEHRGDPLLLLGRDDSEPLGRVACGYPNEDFVRVVPADDRWPASRVHAPDQRRVAGQFTRVGLADLQARGEPLWKVGAVSGLSSGRIHGIDGVTCYTGATCKDGQLKWGSESSMTDGDSGSVSFHPDPEHPDEQVLVAGFNNARTWWPGGNYTWGTAAYHVYRRYGLSF